MVFEKLGRSLFDFLKMNNYRGTKIKKIKNMKDYSNNNKFFCKKKN